MVGEFRNEPLVNFDDPQNRAKMLDALARVEREMGKEYPLIIGGERVFTKEKIKSTNPSNPDEVVGYVSKASREHAEQAMQAALKAFDAWKRVSPDARARCLLKAAAIMRRRRFDVSATMVLEVGKSWVEADADTAEAIDFLEYYAREMMRLGERQPLTRLPDEDNELVYIPLGVGVVIPPWNFPMAILCGMTSSVVVTGNTAVLKPSSNAPVTGYKFMEVMEEAGIPAGVINFVPGSGAEIGDYLVSHPKTRFITFTGSKEVGLRIVELAAKTQPGQIWIKRVIAEMGGKDAIVVDETADLDEAAAGIVTSAFGFSGQKCSACSRVIAVESIYDRLLEKVTERTRKLTVGPVKDPANYMGPVVDKAAYEKILGYIEIGKKEGRLVTGGKPLDIPGSPGKTPGYFIEPTIFADVNPRARIAQEEIFGPVVAFIRAKDFDDALRIANDTEYGLTGSVYSKNRAHLEKAREEFHVGNLYFNRKCTGALVGAHPFGGFNMSGTDSKTGSRDYLLLFMQAKVVSEKL
ncbi:MAG: L-glutamate gamma-semialdehyde dehydrogenase [Firmicutes bacterium]|nr:L-glutamate gamma-semialdehyde dehydrogenase [Candidatus Fermentithermobacillaceae bacterium]